LHFTAWPDFGVPDTPASIAELTFMVDYFQSTLGGRGGVSGPIVVHCSAGIGRAGTFIAIHHAWRLMQAAQQPHVMSLVFRMRQCRSGMVQTDQQYLFIHRTIAALQRRLSGPPSPSMGHAGLVSSAPPSAMGSPIMAPASPHSVSSCAFASELAHELAPLLAFAPCNAPGSPVSNSKRLKSSSGY